MNVRYIRLSIERDSTVALAKKLSSSIVARIHLLQPIKTRIFVAANSLGARMYERPLRLTAEKLISFLGR